MLHLFFIDMVLLALQMETANVCVVGKNVIQILNSRFGIFNVIADKYIQ